MPSMSAAPCMTSCLVFGAMQNPPVRRPWAHNRPGLYALDGEKIKGDCLGAPGERQKTSGSRAWVLA
ncbi:hypothetical protein JCM14635_01490 [Megalodesulfovibrio paquesii]